MPDETVLVLGAGAVRAMGSRRAIAKRPPLDRDFFEIARKVDRELHDQVAKQLAQVVGDYSHDVIRSLEESTTLLYLKAIDSQTGSAPHLAFLNQLRLLEQTLADTTNDLRIGPRSSLYRLIRNELRTLSEPDHLSILTFNYDLTIERTLDELQSHNSLRVLT